MNECNICPKWVVRCAHYEGRQAVLLDFEADPLGNCERNCPVLGRYNVGIATGYIPCIHSYLGCTRLKLGGPSERMYTGADLIAATDFFHEAERKLLE